MGALFAGVKRGKSNCEESLKGVEADVGVVELSWLSVWTASEAAFNCCCRWIPFLFTLGIGDPVRIGTVLICWALVSWWFKSAWSYGGGDPLLSLDGGGGGSSPYDVPLEIFWAFGVDREGSVSKFRCGWIASLSAVSWWSPFDDVVDVVSTVVVFFADNHGICDELVVDDNLCRLKRRSSSLLSLDVIWLLLIFDGWLWCATNWPVSVCRPFWYLKNN